MSRTNFVGNRRDFPLAVHKLRRWSRRFLSRKLILCASLYLPTDSTSRTLLERAVIISLSTASIRARSFSNSPFFFFIRALSQVISHLTNTPILLRCNEVNPLIRVPRKCGIGPESPEMARLLLLVLNIVEGRVGHGFSRKRDSRYCFQRRREQSKVAPRLRNPPLPHKV